MDENWVMGGYFHYGFSGESREYLDKMGEKSFIKNIYEADVSPVGSVHDRACDLY